MNDAHSLLRFHRDLDICRETVTVPELVRPWNYLPEEWFGNATICQNAVQYLHTYISYTILWSRIN